MAKSANQELVTVIIYTYNQEKLVGRCLDGVLSQEPLSNLKVLVIDDASTDATVEVCESYQLRYPDKIEIVALPENELSSGVFVGLKNVQKIETPFIAFCDGDDYWVDVTKIQSQIELFAENPELGLAHSDYFQLFEKNGISAINVRSSSEIDKSKKFKGGIDLVRGNHIKNSTMMIKSNLVDFNFLANSRGIYVNDWLLCVSVTQNHKVSFNPKRTSVVRISENGIWNGSSTEKNLEQKQRVRWYCATYLPESKLRNAFRRRVLLDWTKGNISTARWYKPLKPFIHIFRKVRKKFYILCGTTK